MLLNLALRISGPALTCGTMAMPGNLMARRLHMLHLQNGVAAMAWGCSGYRLVLAEAGMAAQVLELSLAKSPRGSHRILHPSVSQAASGRPAPSEIHILQVSTLAQSSKSTPNFPKCRSTHLFNADETGLRGLLCSPLLPSPPVAAQGQLQPIAGALT